LQTFKKYNISLLRNPGTQLKSICEFDIIPKIGMEIIQVNIPASMGYEGNVLKVAKERENNDRK